MDTADLWEECRDPLTMLDRLIYQPPGAAIHKLYLFAANCLRHFEPEIDRNGDSLREIAKRVADQCGSEEDAQQITRFAESPDLFARFCSNWEADRVSWILHPLGGEIWQAKHKQIRATQAAAIRDIFGNPYRPYYPCRPMRFCARCSSGMIGRPGEKGGCNACHGRGIVTIGPCPYLNDTVIALAQSIYDEERFQDLLMLADALEEAGCTERKCWSCDGYGTHLGSGPDRGNPQCERCQGSGRLPDSLLAHLRSQSRHVKGCWALDLLKENGNVSTIREPAAAATPGG